MELLVCLVYIAIGFSFALAGITAYSGEVKNYQIILMFLLWPIWLLAVIFSILIGLANKINK